MIIFRYLARNVLATTLAVCLVLLLVVVSSRFVQYLADAAAGELDPTVLLAVIGYRLPGFLELILPLAFFLGILLAYGQAYVDNEMTVLHACGMSQGKLVAYTMVVSLLIAGLVAWLTLFVSPSGVAKSESLLNSQRQRGELESLVPGRFYSLRGGKGVTYAKSKSPEGNLNQVFLAESGNVSGGRGMVIVLAEAGFSRKSEDTDDTFLVLENGLRIQGIPGRADFQITDFKEYGQRLEKVKPWELRSQKNEAIETADLWRSSEPAHVAVLQWRVSLPLLVLIVALMAVPLSKTNPRKGRFVKILPAVMLYILYLVALNGCLGALEDGDLPPYPGLYWVHGLFLTLALLILWGSNGWRLGTASGGSQ